MSLLARINLAFGGVFIVGAAVAAYVFWGILESNARREVIAEAGLMMDSALATRAYTSTEILPLLGERVAQDVPPQSIPFYAATQNFLQLRKRHAEYSYKEATLNPTNPRDRAADWEADIIQRFRNDAHAGEVVGERATPLGPVLFLARPIRTEPSCAACHSLPGVAPRALLARYGGDNGFGWQNDEVVGAQVVSVPFSRATDNAQRAFRAFMVSLIVVFAAVFAVVNAVLYVLAVRPMRRVAAIADRVSLGEPGAPPFPVQTATELASLVRSFQRMRKSLEKALRLLES
jgi:protein-histidine pros-kinase